MRVRVRVHACMYVSVTELSFVVLFFLSPALNLTDIWRVLTNDKGKGS